MVGLRGRLAAVALTLLTVAFAAIWRVTTREATRGVERLSDGELARNAESLANSIEAAMSDARGDAIITAHLDFAAQLGRGKGDGLELLIGTKRADGDEAADSLLDAGGFTLL